MSETARAKKVLQVETFLNEKLRPELSAIFEERDRIYADIAELLGLKATVDVIRQANLKPGQPLTTKVDLGCHFYAKAKVADPSSLFVDVGLGFFLELTLDEAVRFVDKKVKVLEERTKALTEESCKTKASIKLSLEGLRELQNIASEDLVKKKKQRRVVNL